MPYFAVVVRQGGVVELLPGDTEDLELNDGDKQLGQFHAENEPEAWRQLITANPQIDGETHRLVVDVDGDAEFAEAKQEFLNKAHANVVKKLELPDDTGAPEEMEEVEEEDSETGEVKKVKKPKKTKKASHSKKSK